MYNKDKEVTLYYQSKQKKYAVLLSTKITKIYLTIVTA